MIFISLGVFRRPTAQMPYRRAYKRPRYGKRDKYSVQQKAFQFSADSGTSSTWLLVPATTLEGMRKVKHLMVNLTIDPDSVRPMWWAIVYVPQGTTVGSINVTTSASATGMYEPNQFVMNCGIADPTAGLSGSAAQSRNLNDGDAITGRQAHQRQCSHIMTWHYDHLHNAVYPLTFSLPIQI